MIKKLFRVEEVKNTQTGEVYCKMPLIAWYLTNKGMPLSFLSGTIVMSYACDPETKRGVFTHLWDAFLTWWNM